MKSSHIYQIEVDVFPSVADLPEDWKILWDEACIAAQKAYAPYSKFKVGAACQTSTGEIFIGNNQENSAYPSGLCAERVCIFHASSVNPNFIFKKMAIVAFNNDEDAQTPASPCGGCRQVLLEYEVKQKQNLEVLFFFENTFVKARSISDLLPIGFGKSMLH